jgi:hypothetical protein
MTTTLMVLLTVLTTSFTDINLTANEPAMVYYSPKNSVVFNFTYTVETQEKGEYAQFAEDLLGLTDVLTETRTIYNLEHVSIGLRTEVDLSRPHKIVAEHGLPIQLLTINEKGLLVGFNMPAQEKKEKKQKKSMPIKAENSHISIDIPSFSEDVISRKSLAEQAEVIAQQIFHLREIRLYLLSGELEHAPADGEAMKQVLNELKRQEKQLLALFVGKKTITTQHYTYEYCPIKNETKTYEKILHFSPENGFTDAENIDAEEIKIQMAYQHQYITPVVEEKKSRKKDTYQPSQLVYNIPGHACVRVIYKGDELKEKTLPIAQFGVDMPLTTELFSGAELPTITISEKTGNITSISK